MKLINNYLYNIFIAISISIILRLLFLNNFGDLTLENEWGVLFNNLKNNGVLAYRSFEGYLIFKNQFLGELKYQLGMSKQPSRMNFS